MEMTSLTLPSALSDGGVGGGGGGGGDSLVMLKSTSSVTSSPTSSSALLGDESYAGGGLVCDKVCRSAADLMQISNDPTPTPSASTCPANGSLPPDPLGLGKGATGLPTSLPSSQQMPQQQQQPPPPQPPSGSSLTQQQHHQQHQQQQQQQQQQQMCSACKKAIRERYLLKALDQLWHEDCLKCSCCDCRLGEVGSTLFAKANLLLCRRDYLRLFGTTGYCAACNKMIPAFEMVMRARGNVYHLECFACQQCNHRFCVGDRFYLCDNKILCEFDYEDRFMLPSMPGAAPAYPYTSPGYNALTQMKRQTQSLSDDVSSGYGSPSPSSL